MKLGQQILLNIILDEFENDSGWLENIAPRGWGICPYMSIVKPCQLPRGLIYFPIIMKLSWKICSNDILDMIENAFGCLKNMATRGRGIFPYMAVYGFCKTLVKL